MLLPERPAPVVTLRCHVRDYDTLRFVAAVIILLVLASLFHSATNAWLQALTFVLIALALIDGILVAIPARVRFGTDGISWTHPLYARRAQLLPYADVGKLDDAANGIGFVHVNYTRLSTSFERARFGKATAEEIRHELRERLETFRRAVAAQNMDGVVVLDTGDGYRANQTPELLLAIVAAPHAKAVQRSKAARKLLEMQDDEET
ncbi:MAG: hypothetical protein ABI461_11495, partial [Polyangiaceae bacterium]